MFYLTKTKTISVSTKNWSFKRNKLLHSQQYKATWKPQNERNLIGDKAHHEIHYLKNTTVKNKIIAISKKRPAEKYASNNKWRVPQLGGAWKLKNNHKWPAFWLLRNPQEEELGLGYT